MHIKPAPAPRDLLPPLLACLPTAFISPRPPPALLPLLSPILRQRVNLLSSAGAGSNGWLPLLCWDQDRASRLGSKVGGMQLEAHPVSGELELQDVERIQYRRLDEETLQARFDVEEFELLPIYLWCETDDQGGAPGWRLAELRSLEDRDDDSSWSDSELQATDAFESKTTYTAPTVQTNGQQQIEQQEEQEDDDDYWASYDRTPGRTPARTPVRRSPAPNTHTFPSATPNQSSEEQDYYARYASEVQPALDSHDPDEEHPDTADSTLNGLTVLQQPQAQHAPQPTDADRSASIPTQRSLFPADPPPYSKTAAHDSAIASTHNLPQSLDPEPLAPRPTSPTSSASSRSVERLEQSAADMTRAEVGVKQYVSAEVKNLFRLARSVGMGRGEFERIVRTELEVLGMLEENDELE